MTLLVATSSLVDPLICTTEEPQSSLMCHYQIIAVFELKGNKKIKNKSALECRK